MMCEAEVRCHLGVETQRDGVPPVGRATWYPKATSTFGDAFAAVMTTYFPQGGER